MPVPQENLWRFLWPRLILLVTIALVPAAAIILHTFISLRKSSYETLQERLVGFTNVAAAQQERFDALAARTSLPPDTTLTILDRNFTIITRQPDPEHWVGLTIAHHPLSLLMQERKRGTVRLTDLDGVVRVHAFASLPGKAGLPGTYVRMSIAETAMLSEVYKNLRGNTFLLFIGALLTLLVAWLSGRILIGRFITERERIEALKSEFISLASHQLRTPLTTIRWIIETFLSGKMAPLTPPQLDLAKDAKACADSMSATIRILLLISRAEAHTFTTKHTIVALSPLLQELRDEYAHVAKKKHLTVTIACPENITMMTDREILREILENLLSNAIHYTPDNGTITLRVKSTTKNRIQCTVTDTGYGIPLSEQERVFSKFFRGANVRKRQTEGSGLGLYLVNILVGILGGTITFSSEENRGTTFSVLLPPSPSFDAEVPPHR